MRAVLVLAVVTGCTPCGADAVRRDDGACALFVASSVDTAAPTADSSPDEPPDVQGATRIVGRHVECLPDDGWIVSADVAPSDVASATVDIAGIVDTADRLETHPMATSDAAHWQLTAALAVVSAASQQSGTSTAFPCEAADALTWRVTVWDGAGRWSDCRVWGADVARLTDARCVEW